MSLYEQKYPNNIRTISGLVNLIKQDDVTLECNTAVGPVGVQLMAIPSNYWSTQWKLYIVDKSSNASVNNITITAPPGYLVNGAPAFTINSNGASLLVRITSNTNFVGQYSVISGGGGGAVTNGANVGTGAGQVFKNLVATIMNFKTIKAGTNITITNNADDITIDASGGGASVISLTNAAYLALVGAGTVIPGQMYLITDAIYTDGGALVQGALNNGQATVQGSGLFLNADYQMVGNYSGVVGFGIAKGIWYATPPQPVANGDCVVWNNTNYRNLTGAWGTDPSLDAVNWVALPKSTTNGYIRAIDFVKYNTLTNTIIYRADKQNNEVDLYIDTDGNSLLLFQWGKTNVTHNKVLGNSSMISTNSYCEFTSNFLSGGKIFDTTSIFEFGIIRKNEITEGGILNIKTNKGLIESNYVSGLNSAIVNQALGGIPVEVGFNTVLSNNRVTSGGQIVFQRTTSGGLVKGNEVTTDGLLQFIECIGQITSCLVSRNGVLSLNIVSVGAGYLGCEVSDKETIAIPIPTIALFQYKKIKMGYSNWEVDLTGADWAAGQLTIPIGKEYGGIFNCSGFGLLTVDKIVNLNSNHRSTFKSVNADSISFQHTLIAGAIPGNMVCDAPASLNVLIGRTNGADQIEYEVSGNLVQRTNIIINA
jgi:hypothetical protein